MITAVSRYSGRRTARNRARLARARARANEVASLPKVGRAPRVTAAERRERIQVLWSKAQAAARSARLLGERGDPDGAANRAYYATFGAARAALAMVRFAQASSKHHGTIYRRFDKLFVQERGLDPWLGRPLFQSLSSTRAAADYGRAQLSAEVAQHAVGEMERFLAAVEPLLKKAMP
jgi:uncharacterized protein (UPF0332 family)